MSSPARREALANIREAEHLRRLEEEWGIEKMSIDSFIDNSEFITPDVARLLRSIARAAGVDIITTEMGPK